MKNKLLTRNSRKELIENICDKFHDDGIKRLSTVGEFSKTTGLYHFTIKDPNYLPNIPFLFVTELFGNEEALPSIKTGHMPGYSRLQYHGDYNGLTRIIQQLITPGMSLPAYIILANEKEITDEQKERFDNSLEYLENIVRFDVPKTRIYVSDADLFSHTYNVD